MAAHGCPGQPGRGALMRGPQSINRQRLTLVVDVHAHDAQVRAETLELLDPVGQHAERHHHQVRAAHAALKGEVRLRCGPWEGEGAREGR